MNARIRHADMPDYIESIRTLFESHPKPFAMPHSKDILDYLCRSAIHITGATKAIVSLYDQKSERLETFLFPQHLWTIDEHYWNMPEQRPFGIWDAGAVVVDDIRGALISEKAKENVKALNISSGMLVPIRYEVSPLGFLCLFAPDKHHVFPNETIKAVEVLTTQAGIALHNARILENTSSIMARFKEEPPLEKVAVAAGFESRLQESGGCNRDDAMKAGGRPVNQGSSYGAAPAISGGHNQGKLGHNEGLSMLCEITGIATSLLDSKELAKKVVEYIFGKLGITMASIWFMDSEKAAMLLEAGAGYRDGCLEQVSSIPLDERFEMARVFLSGEPMIVEDIDGADVSPGTREMIKATAAQSRTCMFLPLKARKTTIGVLSLNWMNQRRFTSEEARFYLSVANQVAIGLENARLHEETERELRMTKAINEVSALISSTLDMEELGQSILGPIKDYFDLEALGVYIANETSAVYEHTRSLHGSSSMGGCLSRNIPFTSDSLMVSAAKMKKMVEFTVDGDLPEVDCCDMTCSPGSPMKRFFLPLTARDRVWAVMGGCCKRDVAFLGLAKQTLEAIAAQIAVGFEINRRYETEKRIADTLQSALLTVPESIPGLRFGSLYRSATEAVKVGGDFYDVFELGDSRVGIIIGDVSGKGLEAATLTSLVKDTVKAYAFEADSPAVVLSKTNDIVHRASPDTRFVTVFYATLNTMTGALTYCNGGHLPGLVKRAAGNIEALKATSPIIGAFEGMQYEDASMFLARGDTLVLYTDGVIEAGRKGVFFDEEKLIDFIHGIESVSVEEIPGLIFKELDSYTQGNLLDDVILLSVVLGD